MPTGIGLESAPIKVNYFCSCLYCKSHDKNFIHQ